MTAESVLELRSVVRNFGQFQALRGVNFRVAAGEIVALVGENGAGKSTAVKIMSGFDTGYAGDLVLNGRVAKLASPADAERHGIAIAQQELSQVGTMTIAENVFLGNTRVATWASVSTLAKKARPYLGLVGLGHVDPRVEIASLTVGERHLVEVARLLSREPNVLILDEPTAALGQAESARIISIVRDLAKKSGKAVIYVSHRLDEIFSVADTIIVFRDGKSLPPVPTREITVDRLVEMMLGRPLTNAYPPRGSTLSGEALFEIRNFLSAGMRERVSLSVHAGEILGLSGQLGSGASELIAGLAAAKPRISGEVILEELHVFPRNPREAKRLGIAYCSSDRKHDGLFAGLSVQKNLTAPALSLVSKFGWLLGRTERELALEIAQEMTVETSRMTAQVGVLSGGNQQKVALGKWLSILPRVLLVDEPTRGVDVGARSEIYSRIRRLASQGVAVIVASTDLQEIAHLPDTVATFYHGRMIDHFPLERDETERILRDITHPDGTGSTREEVRV